MLIVNATRNAAVASASGTQSTSFELRPASERLELCAALLRYIRGARRHVRAGARRRVVRRRIARLRRLD